MWLTGFIKSSSLKCLYWDLFLANSDDQSERSGAKYPNKSCHTQSISLNPDHPIAPNQHARHSLHSTKEGENNTLTASRHQISSLFKPKISTFLIFHTQLTISLENQIFKFDPLLQYIHLRKHFFYLKKLKSSFLKKKKPKSLISFGFSQQPQIFSKKKNKYKFITFQTVERIPAPSGIPWEAILLNSPIFITFFDSCNHKSDTALNRNFKN